MIKKSIKLVASLLVAVLTVTLAIGAVPAKAAKQVEKTTTIQADITGDGKNDSIKFEFGGLQDGFATNLTVYVNDKKALSFNDLYFFAVGYDILSFDDGKPFLFLHLSEENDDGPNGLYAYKSGKLKKVLDFNKSVSMCMYVNSLNVKGNKLTVGMGSSGIPGLGVSSFKAIYKYSNGKIKLASKTHKFTGYAGKKPGQIKVAYSFDIYSDKTCKKRIATVPVGAKVKVTKIYVYGTKASVYVESKDYKGWYRCYSYDKEPNLNVEGFCGTYFENTWMAG